MQNTVQYKQELFTTAAEVHKRSTQLLSETSWESEWSHFLNAVGGLQPATLLKQDSITSIFLQIQGNVPHDFLTGRLLATFSDTSAIFTVCLKLPSTDKLILINNINSCVSEKFSIPFAFRSTMRSYQIHLSWPFYYSWKSHSFKILCSSLLQEVFYKKTSLNSDQNQINYNANDITIVQRKRQLHHNCSLNFKKVAFV